MGEATISGDGRFVAFTSFSDALVSGDTNGTRDILVKDRTTGTIVLVSRAANGTAANQSSNRAEISLGGDWVVFESSADNLAATDGNGGFTDVFRASNPLVIDDLRGGTGDDPYDLARLDTVTELASAGVDTIRSSVTRTLPTNVERLTLTGLAGINGTGNVAANTIIGNNAANTLSGAAGADKLTGGDGPDTFVLSSPAGVDKVQDLATGVDEVRVAMSSLPIGDRDQQVEGAATRAAPGGYSRNAELVVFTRNAPGLTTAQAAAAIGSATSPFPDRGPAPLRGRHRHPDRCLPVHVLGSQRRRHGR